MKLGNYDMDKRLAGYAAIIVIGLAAPWLFPGYKAQMTELWLFIVFALAWDHTGGQMGYNSFGNVVFMGVGMYVCALTQVGLFYSIADYTAARGGGTIFIFDVPDFLLGLALGLPAAAIAAAVVAAVLGSAVLGMRGQYFAICTLGLGIAAGEIAAGWEWIGAGSGMTTPNPPDGLGDINRFLYFLSAADPPAVQRGNIVLSVGVVILLALAALIVAGGFSGATVVRSAVLTPFYILGAWAGARLFAVAPKAYFRKVALVLLIATGVLVLVA